MKWNRHIFAVCAIAMFVGMLYFKEATKHHVIRRAGGPMGPNQKVRKFDSVQFIALDSTNAWSALDDRFRFLAKTNGTNWEHADALLGAIKQFVGCYSTNRNFEDYVKFRTSGVPYNFKFPPGAVGKLIEREKTNLGKQFPSNSLEQARLVWNSVTEASLTNGRSGITAIAPERASIFIRRLPTDYSPIFTIATSNSGAFVIGQYPTVIRALYTPTDEIKPDKTVLYSVIGLPCEANGDTDIQNAHYLHMSLFWSERYQRWLPLELVDDACLRMPRATNAPIVFPESFSFPMLF